MKIGLPISKRAIATISLTALLVGCSASDAVYAKKQTVTFMCWFNQMKAFKAVKDAFEKKNPDIQIKLIDGGGDVSRLLTLMSGGVGPDVGIFDQNISAYVLRNLLVPLDPYLKKDGLKASDFWAPTYRECQWNGKVWAMGWSTHSNFANLYNKRLFREAGIDPRAPRTVSELEAISPKLTVKDDKGMLKRVGIVPWQVYGYGNTVYTWGWIFGGEFYDPATKKITCAEPKVVKAVEWINNQVLKVGGISKYSQVVRDQWLKGSGCYHFFQEKAAMAFAHPAEIPLIKQFNSNGMDIAVGKLPVAEGVEDPAWVGGWKMGIVSSSKPANRTAAWKWLKFMTADPEGTAILCGTMGEFPTYKKSRIYDEYRKDPIHRDFAEVLASASKQRPIIPVSDTLANNLNTALDQVLTGKKSALDALTLAQTDTQKQLQRYIGRYKF